MDTDGDVCCGCETPLYDASMCAWCQEYAHRECLLQYSVANLWAAHMVSAPTVNVCAACIEMENMRDE